MPPEPVFIWSAHAAHTGEQGIGQVVSHVYCEIRGGLGHDWVILILMGSPTPPPPPK